MLEPNDMTGVNVNQLGAGAEASTIKVPNEKNGVVFNEKVEKDVVDFVVSEFERYERACKPRFDRCKQIYARWKNEPPKREEDWQNQVNVPVMFEGEQTITPRLFTALFPNDAPVDVLAEGDVSVEQAIRIKFMLQHVFRNNNVQTKSIPMLSQTVLFGTGYADAGSWMVRKGWIVGEDGQRRESTIEAKPNFANVDFFELFPHPAKVTLEDGLPVIRRRFVDAELLKRMADDNKIMNIEKALNSKGEENKDKDYERTEGDEYELLEFWGPYNDEVVEKDTKTNNNKITARKGVPYWCVVINRRVLIRFMPNPYNHQMAPYIKSTLWDDAKPSWFGYGLGDAGLSTQDRLNKIVNQRLDNVDLVLNKQGFFNGTDPLINTKKLEISKPGQWHRVSDTVSSIRWMETPDVTQSSYNEEKIAKDDFRESTGATAQLMPTEGGQHRTAMGINLLTEAAGMRFRPVLRKMEIDIIQQSAMFFFSNLKQFMTESEWVVITGKSGKQESVKITPEQIQAKVMFVPTGISETMNKETAVNQLLKFREITKDDPTVNRREINKRLAEYFGFKDLGELVVAGQPISRDGLDTKQQMAIQQRVAEGATPDQIKQELLGPRPAPQASAQELQKQFQASQK